MSVQEDTYYKLRREIIIFLDKTSTKKIMANYADKKIAKAHLKKHLMLSLKANIKDIQKILDELI